MSLQLPPAGRTRALALDLHDISDAIHNLPADSSALLPSPALPMPRPMPPASQASPSSAASPDDTPSPPARPGPCGHPSAAAVVAAPKPTPPFALDVLAAAAAWVSGPVLPPAAAASPSDAALERATALAVRAGKRRVTRDLARSRFSAERFAAALAARTRGREDGATTAAAANQESGAGEHALDRLGRAWRARSRRAAMRTVGAAAGGVTVDAASVHVLTQSLVGSGSGSGSGNQAFAAQAPGTVLSWTKYFQGVADVDALGGVRPTQREASLGPAAAAAARLPPLPGHKRRRNDGLPPSPPAAAANKRRLVSWRGAAGAWSDSNNGNDGAGNAGRPCTSAATAVRFDLLSSVASCPDLVLHVCDYLPLRDILALYAISRVFKSTVDSNLQATVLRFARRFASAETLAVFPWQLYRKATVATAAAAGAAAAPRRAPSLCYVNMVVSRERAVRDIVACLARAGHRLPPATATGALKKMWLLMDVPTNRGRVELLRNEALFADADLLTIQMFHVKLVLFFHDPLAGAGTGDGEAGEAGEAGEVAEDGAALAGPPAGGSFQDWAVEAAAAADAVMRQQQAIPQHALVEALLGQRGGLHALWSLLRGKAYRTPAEVVELKVRYDYIPSTLAYDVGGDGDGDGDGDGGEREEWGLVGPRTAPPGHSPRLRQQALADVVHRVPLWEMGVGHLEGWGLGTQHLLRPDELVPLEAGRRRRVRPDAGMAMDSHVPFMAVWGYRDFATGGNLVPTVDEMYMSDDDEDDDDDGAAAAGSIARSVAHDADDVLAMPELRIGGLCGNVAARPGEWQPRQVLKAQWDGLTLRQKLDVWWLNHQERLRQQGWTQRDNRQQQQQQPPPPLGIDNVSYAMAEDSEDDEGYGPAAEEEGVGDSLDDADDEYDDEEGYLFDADADADADAQDLLLPGFGLPSSASAPAASSSSSSSADASSSALPGEAAAGSLPARHQSIVASCVRWALREQDEVDEALLAQADLAYASDELAHWDQFLTATDIAGGSSDGDDDSDSDSASDSASASSDTAAAALQPPNPEVVLVPEYGGPNEVLRIVGQLRQLDAALAAAALAAAAAPAGSVPPPPQPSLAQCKTLRRRLRRELDAALRGEVLAIEF